MDTLMITLEAARVNKGLTQEAAAEVLGCTPDTLRRYEKGRIERTRVPENCAFDKHVSCNNDTCSGRVQLSDCFWHALALARAFKASWLQFALSGNRCRRQLQFRLGRDRYRRVLQRQFKPAIFQRRQIAAGCQCQNYNRQRRIH